MVDEIDGPRKKAGKKILGPQIFSHVEHSAGTFLGAVMRQLTGQVGHELIRDSGAFLDGGRENHPFSTIRNNHQQLSEPR